MTARRKEANSRSRTFVPLPEAARERQLSRQSFQDISESIFKEVWGEELEEALEQSEPPKKHA
jgi:hypothetical protein